MFTKSPRSYYRKKDTTQKEKLRHTGTLVYIHVPRISDFSLLWYLTNTIPTYISSIDTIYNTQREPTYFLQGIFKLRYTSLPFPFPSLNIYLPTLYTKKDRTSASATLPKLPYLLVYYHIRTKMYLLYCTVLYCTSSLTCCRAGIDLVLRANSAVEILPYGRIPIRNVCNVPTWCWR